MAALRQVGIQPDAIVVRSDRPIEDAERRKISLFCDVPHGAVINAVDPDAPEARETPEVAVSAQERAGA